MRFNLLASLATTLAGLAVANPLPDALAGHGDGLALKDLVARDASPAGHDHPHDRRHPSSVQMERNFYSMSVNVTVAKCDTLTSIARKYNSGVCDIARANPGVITNPNFIAEGAVITVPVNVANPDDTSCLPATTAPFVPGSGETLNPDGSLNYTVVQGDTLTIIAQKFNSGICDIAKKNSLPDPNLIEIRQVLAVPLNVANPDNTSCLKACVPSAATSRRGVPSPEYAVSPRHASSPGKTAARRDASMLEKAAERRDVSLSEKAAERRDLTTPGRPPRVVAAK